MVNIPNNFKFKLSKEISTRETRDTIYTCEIYNGDERWYTVSWMDRNILQRQKYTHLEVDMALSYNYWIVVEDEGPTDVTT